MTPFSNNDSETEHSLKSSLTKLKFHHPNRPASPNDRRRSADNHPDNTADLDAGQKPSRSSSSSSSSSSMYAETGIERWKHERSRWTSPSPGYVAPRSPPPPLAPARIEQVFNSLLTPDPQPLPAKIPLSQLVTILGQVRELST